MINDELFIGFDCHKETHYLVAINFKNKIFVSLQFENNTKGFKACHKKLSQLSKNYKLSIGIEGAYGLGKHLAKYLINNDFEVHEVCSSLTKSRRNRTSGWNKSDEGDALIIAKLVRDDEHQLPVVHFKSSVEAVTIMSRRRSDLVKKRTCDYNQLHAILLAYDPEYKELGTLTAINCQNYWLQYCESEEHKEKLPEKRALLFSIKGIINSIQNLNQKIKEVEKEMEVFETDDTITLQSMTGIGRVQAFKLMSSIGDIKRFSSARKLASYSGNSPICFASGTSSNTRINLRGCRDLNCTFDQIALTSMQHDELAAMYYEKKRNEGKTKKQARRYLARRLINIIFAMLKNKTTYNPKHKPLAKKIKQYKKEWDQKEVLKQSV